MRTRFFIVEARRLLPLLFLFILLVGLSVYDNFFRFEPATEVTEEAEDVIVFSTTDRGDLDMHPAFQLAYEEDEWEKMREEAAVTIPDYPFNAEYEVAILSLNSEIESIRPVPQGDDVLQVEVRVTPRENYYHVVTVEREEVDAEETYWVFMDEEERVISQLAPFKTVDEGEQEEVSPDEEEGEGEVEQVK